MAKTLITGAVIVPMTDAVPEYFTGSVALEGNRIVLVSADNQKVEAFRKANPDCRVIDGRGRLVMPGLINTHTHVSMTLLRNFADDRALMPWLTEHIWPFEAHMGADEIALGARLGMAEMLLSGTTTLVDMYWHEAAVGRAASEMGIRAVLCASLLDGERMDEFERDLPATLKVAATCERLSVRIAPHAAYTTSPENLRRAVALARQHGLGLTIHVSETQDEQRTIRERYNATPTEHLHSLGLFDADLPVPTIAAHCVYLSDGDMDILRDGGVTVAHNPQSNMKLASGAAQVAKMLSRGINVSLGTDGASSNNDLDMWDEMRSASLLGKLTAADPAVMPAYEVLKMATVHGARALGMEGLAGQKGRLGVIAEGALADVIVLDTRKPHWCPANNPVSALVYSAKASDVESVFVAGQQIVAEGRVVGLDMEALMHEVEKTTAKIRRTLQSV
jgi:5-methylthioadenosine/S-adenosylhomocysteine deaminase